MRKNCIFSFLLIGFLSVVNMYADANVGAKLFDGSIPFKNGGVSCAACHTVNSKSVIGGGKLAINLTELGGAGVEYTITKPENASSPIMQNAFKGKPITESERKDLVAFFDKVASEKSNASSHSFVIKGVIGAIILFILLSLLGSRRKKESVNKKLYDRQLKSSWKESSK